MNRRSIRYAFRSAAMFCAAFLAILGGLTQTARAVGGVGGASFIIQCDGGEKVSKVLIRSGRRLDSIGIECQNVASGNRRTFRVGGNGGIAYEFGISDINTIFVDQVVVFTGSEFCGADTLRVCGVQFWRTDGGHTLYGTKSRTETVFSNIPETLNGAGVELYGFRGRSGNEIDNLEPLLRPRNRPGPLAHRSTSAQNLADALNVVLSRMQVHIHNWGDRTIGGWHREGFSWVKVDSLIRPFTIPEVTYRRDKGTRRRYFYANDINSTAVFLSFERQRSAYVLRMEFEDAGKEIVSFCRYKKPNGTYRDCSGSPPDVEWLHPALEVTLLPVVYNRNGVNGITLRPQAARLLGDFRLDGICGSVPKECKRIIGEWEGGLLSAVEKQLTLVLSKDAITKLVAQASRTVLDVVGLTGPVLDTYIDGRDLVVGYNQPPTVRIRHPLDGDAGTTDTFWEFDGVGKDPEEGELPIRWESSVSGVLNKGTTLGLGTELPEGKHKITASVKDSFGLTASASVTVTVSDEPPVVHVTAPLSKTQLVLGKPLRLSGAGYDPDSGRVLESKQLRWTVRPQPQGEMRRTTPVFEGQGATVTVPASKLAPGFYLVELVGVDNTGAKSGTRVQIFVPGTRGAIRRKILGIVPGEGFIARKHDQGGAFVEVTAKAEARKGAPIPAKARVRWYLYHAGERTLVCDSQAATSHRQAPNKTKKRKTCDAVRVKLYPATPSKPPILNEYALGLVIETNKGTSGEALMPFHISFPPVE